MNEFTTVFEITAGSNGIRADALLRFGIGAAAVIGGIVWLRSQEGFIRKVSPAFMIGSGVFWLAMHMPLWKIATFDIHDLLTVYRSGQCEITEGVIHVTHQQPAQGHSSGDKITIGEKEFEIDYFLVTPGYSQTIAHGGVLGEGVFARLHHHNGVILKVEVMRNKAGQPGAAAESWLPFKIHLGPPVLPPWRWKMSRNLSKPVHTLVQI